MNFVTNVLNKSKLKKVYKEFNNLLDLKDKLDSVIKEGNFTLDDEHIKIQIDILKNNLSALSRVHLTYKKDSMAIYDVDYFNIQGSNPITSYAKYDILSDNVSKITKDRLKSKLVRIPSVPKKYHKTSMPVEERFNRILSRKNKIKSKVEKIIKSKVNNSIDKKAKILCNRFKENEDSCYKYVINNMDNSRHFNNRTIFERYNLLRSLITMTESKICDPQDIDIDVKEVMVIFDTSNSNIGNLGILCSKDFKSFRYDFLFIN